MIFDPVRFKLVAGGERAGKSWTAAMLALAYTPYADLGWIVARDYKQSRAEFEYLMNSYADLGMLASATLPKSEYQPAVLQTKTGLVVRTITAADESKLGMVAPDWIIGAETAQLTYSTYLRLRGRLAQKRGFLFMEGTFEESQDWYAELYDEWAAHPPGSLERSYSLPSWSNTAIFPGGYDDPEMVSLRAVLGADRFSERHGGKPVPPATVVFPEFRIQDHVRPFAHLDSSGKTTWWNPFLPVEMAIDPGFAGAYSIQAIQWDNNNVYVIDELYEHRKAARQIIREAQSRPWMKNVNRRAAGVIDIAAAQHHEGKSHLEYWQEAGFSFATKFVPIQDGINLLRAFLRGPSGLPRIYYNADRTQQSVREFKKYQYPKDQEGRAVKERPIDRDNHSIKGITYWLHYRYGGITGRRRTTVKRTSWGINNGNDRAFPGPGKRPIRRGSRVSGVRSQRAIAYKG